MKNSIVIIFILHFSVSVNAQIYVAGDTTGKHVYSLESWFNNATVKINIDCTDTADLSIDSHVGGQFPYDWARLSLRYSDSVEVALSNNNGTLGRYREGDTIPLGNDLWTRYLDFIFGTGAMGPYGVSAIDTSYLAFRKIDNNDTSYVFVLATTVSANIFIHKIISECPVNPVQEFTEIEKISNDNITLVYPNPFSNQVTFTLADNVSTTVSLYNFLGQQVLQQTFTNSTTINTEQLADGIYFYELRNNKGTLKTSKVVKQ